MFHVKPEEIWLRAAYWAGEELDTGQIGALHRYREWLLDEAINAGGLGPDEGERVDTRHIGDSLLFASAFDTVPGRLVDLGSGVGLPGIPLALLYPDSEIVLLDRAGRRADLCRRACRILELENVQVIQGEIAHLESGWDAVVSRATLPPVETGPVFHRLLAPGGTAVMGGSWQKRPEATGWDIVEVPVEVLDHEVWLLIMRRS